MALREGTVPRLNSRSLARPVPDPLLLWFVVVGSVVALLYQGIAIVFGYAMPRLDPPGPPAARAWPRVSAVVAARNEELDLPVCLDGLLSQDYPNLEVIVVDGGSTDRTREVVAARGNRVRLLREPPLPAGWVGKSWACHLGFGASSGDWVLFTDADMRYHPGAVRAAVEWAEREGADLATLGPRIEMGGFWENVVLPFYTQMVLTYLRAPRVNRPDSHAAMANGQFLLVRRSAYEKVGGHEAIRSDVLEDVRLAQQFRNSGLRLRIAWAPELLSTRMYRDRAEMFEGILKTVHGTRFSALRQGAFLAGLVGFFWLPLLVLPVALLWGIPLLAVWGAFLYIALFGKHVAFTRSVRGRAWAGLLYPVAVGYYIALVAVSIARGARRRPVVWKGRSYPVDPTAPVRTER
jgi:glycosyltransferase involved in cell wall biosynthesis